MDLQQNPTIESLSVAPVSGCSSTELPYFLETVMWSVADGGYCLERSLQFSSPELTTASSLLRGGGWCPQEEEPWQREGLANGGLSN